MACTLLAGLVAPVAAQSAQRPSEGRWRAGVIEIVVRAEVEDGCIRIARAFPRGVSRATLDLEVVFERPSRPPCERRPAGVVERVFNFPSISRAVDTVSIVFMFEGRERGRENLPISRGGR